MRILKFPNSVKVVHVVTPITPFSYMYVYPLQEQWSLTVQRTVCSHLSAF